MQPDNLDLFYKLAMALIKDHSNYPKAEYLLQQCYVTNQMSPKYY